jgi:ABC-type Fe3+-hydroxamate transport system substrate-binding protein
MIHVRHFVAALLVAPALAWSAPVLAQATPTCEPGTRLFENALLLDGPVCVPDAPGRIAFIDDNVVYAMELGIPTITRSYYSNIIVADFPGLAARLDPATTSDVGNTWEMKGEALLAAQPDLVVTAKYWDAAIGYARDIAPTIVIDDAKAATWLDLPRMVADLFGKQAEQAALEADLQSRVAALRTALAASGKGTSFTFTQVEAADSFWTFTTDAFGPEFAVDVGMQPGPSIPTPEEAAKLPGGSSVALPVSQENLAFIDADHLFFYANTGSDAEALVKDNPIFQKFAADRSGRIHFLKGEYWFRGSASSAHRIIDDIYRHVLAVEPRDVSPNPLAWTYESPAP